MFSLCVAYALLQNRGFELKMYIKKDETSAACAVNIT